jgi:hypothetical protein
MDNMTNFEIFISVILIILFILIIIMTIYLIYKKIKDIRIKAYNKYLTKMLILFEDENKSRDNDNIIDSTIDLEKKLSDIMNLRNNKSGGK